MLVDTHCHIHEPTYPLDIDGTLDRARQAGVTTLLCVGTSQESSFQALEFAAKHPDVYATVGVHPHDAKDGWGAIAGLAGSDKVVAVGEIGLDYFYNNSPRQVQIEALEEQIEIALKHKLPIIFHVRDGSETTDDAFEDFWEIFDRYDDQIRGVLHSFTDSAENLQKALDRGLYIGVNGISTFTKDDAQRALFASIPLDRLLLETDAPFLTPHPFRGKVNEPAFVKNIAEFHASLRNQALKEVATATTANAHALFAI